MRAACSSTQPFASQARLCGLTSTPLSEEFHCGTINAVPTNSVTAATRAARSQNLRVGLMRRHRSTRR
jgi:hypothetical protein